MKIRKRTSTKSVEDAREARCWVDENNVSVFRSDVEVSEARELDAIMRQAFNAGMAHGYKARGW